MKGCVVWATHQADGRHGVREEEAGEEHGEHLPDGHHDGEDHGAELCVYVCVCFWGSLGVYACAVSVVLAPIQCPSSPPNGKKSTRTFLMV